MIKDQDLIAMLSERMASAPNGFHRKSSQSHLTVSSRDLGVDVRELSLATINDAWSYVIVLGTTVLRVQHGEPGNDLLVAAMAPWREAEKAEAKERFVQALEAPNRDKEALAEKLRDPDQGAE